MMLATNTTGTRAVSACEIVTEPVFSTSRKAVRFAVLFEGRPQGVNLMSSGGGGGRLGGGSDPAAQAGLVWGALATLGPVLRAALVTDVAPQTVRCICERDCCRGTRNNWKWVEAARVLQETATRELALPVALGERAMLRVMARVYGRGEAVGRIAKFFRVDVEEVLRVERALHKWVWGVPRKIDGVNSRAWNAADEVLLLRGVVGEM